MEINGTSDFGVFMLLISSWKHIESFKFSKNTQGLVLTETMSNAYTHIANGCKLLHARLRQQSFIDLTRVSNVVIQCEFSPLFVGSTVEHREPLTTHDPDLLREGDRTVEGRAAPYGQITTLQLHSARCCGQIRTVNNLTCYFHWVLTEITFIYPVSVSEHLLNNVKYLRKIT